jgi:hypothetical protein
MCQYDNNAQLKRERERAAREDVRVDVETYRDDGEELE